VPGRTENRKSLTVLHIQRRLTDEGFSDAQSAPGGRYEALTTRAVSLWQESRKEPATGVLTREQFADLFEGDPNVTVTIDSHEDHKA
jgi:peptidoglycan hydrolase-like protein with peptidoglycan-binding domain